MPWFDFFWSDEPDDNVEHVAEHDLTPEDVEDAKDQATNHRSTSPASRNRR
jgi:hypothetical protein